MESIHNLMSCKVGFEVEVIKMTEEQVRVLADAINNLASAIRELGEKIAWDEPLNYTLGRALGKIAESIERK